MELSRGYRQTDVGVIPEDWDVEMAGNLVDSDSPICYGVVQVGPNATDGIPIVAIKYLDDIANSPLHRAEPALEQRFARSRVRGGDILVSVKGTIGRVGVVSEGFQGNISRELARLRPREGLCGEYIAHQLEGGHTQERIARAVVGTTRLEFSIATLRAFTLPVPRTDVEQRAIAAALGDADALLAGVDRLIAKKRNLKQAAMQQLLTGRTRLPGFRGGWKVKRIADIARPKSEKNLLGDSLPVVTCSKHLGFVDSLGFFRNQVFSDDLSSYKLIRRGEIGYPANHVEEGSIGLQDLYDLALVSPIYIVFAVSDDVSSLFLHRLLKLDAYRQKFKTATAASVDRRGSLRWPAFSALGVQLPSLPEQTAIAEVIRDMEAELVALEARREKTRALKQAMMQELLTGRTRLV